MHNKNQHKQRYTDSVLDIVSKSGFIPSVATLLLDYTLLLKFICNTIYKFHAIISDKHNTMRTSAAHMSQAHVQKHFENLGSGS